MQTLILKLNTNPNRNFNHNLRKNFILI